MPRRVSKIHAPLLHNLRDSAMKITKGKAFVYSLVAILTIYATTAILLRIDASGAAFTAVVALASMYIVGNVADNGVKGKFFNEGLK